MTRILIGAALALAVLKFTSKDVAKVYIDPRTCHVLANGDLECKCRVVLATVDVEELK